MGPEPSSMTELRTPADIDRSPRRWRQKPEPCTRRGQLRDMCEVWSSDPAVTPWQASGPTSRKQKCLRQKPLHRNSSDSPRAKLSLAVESQLRRQGSLGSAWMLRNTGTRLCSRELWLPRLGSAGRTSKAQAHCKNSGVRRHVHKHVLV